MQAAVAGPLVLAEAAVFFLIAGRMGQHIHGIALPLRAFALALLLLPLYCFWRMPARRHEARVILTFVVAVCASVAAAILVQLPVLLWLGVALLVLPVLVALKRREMVWS